LNITLTDEQQAIVDFAKNPTSNLIKIQAGAGNGKTQILKLLVKELNPQRGLYTAFNKAIVEESAKAFPDTIMAKTLHSVAYKFVIKKYNYTIDNFTYLCIEENIEYKDKLHIMNLMELYCNSGAIDLNKFLGEENHLVKKLVRKYLMYMYKGIIPVTFAFLLKRFHMDLYRKAIDPVEFDLIMLDECQDTTGVMLAIIQLLPAKLKVLVGDTYQTIYSFMNTVNGFEVLKDEGKLFKLTNTFRCSKKIASAIENFGRATIGSDFTFNSMQQPDIKETKDCLYLARTNSTLIARMIELMKSGVHFSTIRKPVEIFELPLAIYTIQSGKELRNRKYKYIEIEYKMYLSSSSLQNEYPSFFTYLMSEFKHDIPLLGAIKLMSTYKIGDIFEVFKYAKEVKNDKILLSSIHAAKGLESDMVYIEEDINSSLKKILDGDSQLSQEEIYTEMLLAYVAFSRAKFTLTNAKILERFID
jgi:superfamily I DNA/RNA helicase